MNFSIDVIAMIITRGTPADFDAEYAGKPSGARSTSSFATMQFDKRGSPG